MHIVYKIKLYINMKIEQIDKKIVFYFQNNPFPMIITRFFQFITILGDYAFIWWILSCIFIFLGWEFQIFGIRLLVWIFVIIIFGELILKRIFQRKRPFEKYQNIKSIAFHTPSSFSFPSGHTSMAFMSLVILFDKLEIFTLIFLIFIVFSIIFSRIFLRVHYFTDIIGWIIFGWIIGILLNLFI